MPPNKALQLTANSAIQLWFGSLLASTSGAWAASEALLAAAERRSVGRRVEVADSTFILRATARSAGATGFPPGEKHIALVFVLAASPEAADQGAIDLLESTGWSDVQLEERGAVNVERLNGEPDFVNAYERCLAAGSAGIIFEDPLEQ